MWFFLITLFINLNFMAIIAKLHLYDFPPDGVMV